MVCMECMVHVCYGVLCCDMRFICYAMVFVVQDKHIATVIHVTKS